MRSGNTTVDSICIVPCPVPSSCVTLKSNLVAFTACRLASPPSACVTFAASALPSDSSLSLLRRDRLALFFSLIAGRREEC